MESQSYKMKPELKIKDTSFDFTLFSTIMHYVVLIILGPIITFFGTKIIIFDGILKTTTVTSNVSAAVAAIIVLHVMVGMYIYRAYSEAGKAKPVKLD